MSGSPKVLVRKARAASPCPVCRGAILPGQQIARVDGEWQHVEHVTARLLPWRSMDTAGVRAAR